MTDWPSKTADALRMIAERRPRIHCLTNAVAPELSANMLLAIGAQPSVTGNPAEVADFLTDSAALLANLGTLSEERRLALEIAAKAMHRLQRPWIMDPVKIHRSPQRLEFARHLLAFGPSIIRSNASEAEALGPVVAVQVITGAADRVQQAGRVAEIGNGHPLMDRVTAMGCAGSAVIAAFAAILDDPFDAAVCGLLAVNVAGEIAAEQAAGPGSFKPLFLDALYNLDAAALAGRATVTS